MSDVATIPDRPATGHRFRNGLVLAGAAALVLAGAAYALWAFTTRFDRAALDLLRARNSLARQRGAWLVAGEYAPRSVRYIAAHVSNEPERDVRESFVYALGRAGDASHFDLVAGLLRTEPEAYVRQAVWLAAARLDPARFATLAEADEQERAGPQGQPDAWDEIGLAYAWLEVGDVRGLERLLHWAVAGLPEQRRAAAQALYRRLMPLLEAAGRWPIDATVDDNQPWPPEFVAEIRRRCAEVDLPALAAEAREHAARAAVVRRHAGKVNKARERLAWLLSGL